MRKFLKDNLATIGWLVLAGFLMALLFFIGYSFNIRLYLIIGSFTASMWVFLWMGNAYMSVWLDGMISWQTDAGKRFTAGVVGMFVYTFAAVYFLAWFYRFFIHFDVGDDINGTLYGTIIITVIISMFMTGRSFLINWKQAAVDAEASKREFIKAQYESLKNQVNPHFLFNSLNALTHLVYEDPDKAAKFIKQLSEVYRYVLDTRDKEVVPLEEELKFLDAYMFLQQIRFGDKLSVKRNLDGIGTAVAPLSLQMLIENAIKHNEISGEYPLKIDLYEEGEFIVVENSLHRKNRLPEVMPGLGLDNIRKRYEFLSEIKVEVSDQDGKFKVKLPCIKIPT